MNELEKKLKAEHGTIFKLDVPLSDESVKTIYLRKLDRVTYSAGSKLLEKNELQAAEVFLKGLYVGGDDIDEVIKDFDGLRAASNLLVDIIGVKEGNVAKL